VKESEALDAARRILGQRAILRTGKGLGRCIVARAELNVEGRRHERVYGEAPTWSEALRKAEASYRAMVAESQRKARSEK
jgi:hypothetical protein